MDSKGNKYNLENIPEKLWDGLSEDAKRLLDKNIDQKLKGDVKPERNDTLKNDIAYFRTGQITIFAACSYPLLFLTIMSAIF